MGQGRAAWLLLEGIPRGETGLRLRHEERVKAGFLLGAQGGIDLPVELTIDHAADMTRPSRQGVERGKLIVLPHQFLDGHIDEIG